MFTERSNEVDSKGWPPGTRAKWRPSRLNAGWPLARGEGAFGDKSDEDYEDHEAAFGDEVNSAQGPDPATADYTVGWREEDEKEKRFPSQIRFLIDDSAVLHR